MSTLQQTNTHLILLISYREHSCLKNRDIKCVVYYILMFSREERAKGKETAWKKRGEPDLHPNS